MCILRGEFVQEGLTLLKFRDVVQLGLVFFLSIHRSELDLGFIFCFITNNFSLKIFIFLLSSPEQFTPFPGFSVSVALLSAILILELQFGFRVVFSSSNRTSLIFPFI